MLAVSMAALVGFLALAIDLGMLVIARTQAQNAADLASLTAARTLTGDPTTGYNQNNATTNSQNMVGYNKLLGQSIQSSQLQLTYGTFDYNQNTQTFNANFPGTSGMPLTAVTATITSNNLSAAFSSAYGAQFLPAISATATAVHRPRDIGLVMDLSGSMRMGTLLGYDFYTNSRTTNNPDTVYPTFGAYSSGSAGMQGPTSTRTSAYDNYTISPSNTTASNSSYSLTYVNNFYQNAAYASTLIRAFDSATSTDGGNTWTAATAGSTPQLPPSSYTATPGGDVPLFKQGSTSTYATNVKDVTGATTANALWELDGYSAYAAGLPDTSGTGGVPQVWTQVDYTAPTTPPANGSLPFNGYTQGPGYYGMSFFLWPPDPRDTNAITGSSLTGYLGLLGVTNTTDQNTLAGIWSNWQGQGAAGFTKLQNWLKGNGTNGASSLPQANSSNGYYSPTSSSPIYVPNITTWNGTTLTNANKPKTYYAVCRLFNQSFPTGPSNGTSVNADWRLRFFGTNDNTKLFNTSGSLNLPGSTTYTINYNAILSWITQSANSSGQLVNPFPQQMRAGRVKYYGSIPTQITGSWPSYGGTDQRFWKEFIDFVLGFRQTGASTYQDVSAMAGYGSDFSWGTKAITAPPGGTQYMSYSDNPLRPKMRYWFGPMMMVDFMHNYNMLENVSGYTFMQPGDSYEAPVYTGKQAYLGAIDTMRSNHPNDWFSTICYSWPRGASNGTASNGSGLGRFNCVRSPMGPNYSYAHDALLFPFSTINADGTCNNTEVTPYDSDPATSQIPSANFVDTPRADGDTCFAMALMLAYNQFAMTLPTDTTLRSYVTSSPITFPLGMAGGMGRKGAQKVVIFETDGLANTSATASLVSAGTYKYYQIRYDMNKPNSSEYPTVNASTINDPNVLNQVYSLVQQLATDYGGSRNPFRLYALGFGPVFTGTNASSALQTLQTMQYYGGTQSSTTTPLPSSQIITGTDSQMAANMISTFTNILQSGVQIALIK
jgi:hypothetical protein